MRCQEMTAAEIVKAPLIRQMMQADLVPVEQLERLLWKQR
ncbi:hypothetical protein GGI59_001527 [Rhizobium lentis]|uniref:Uncharacterized protein n=1 Tax=Rhizobium lentis TaxID=1138194 RepID=A0A7W8ULZ0_9HYPH|nr:hypothetical protein [Rhizobium lentis]MBB5549349.1 hypothetical protein [Rhizobium lentis]MBB5559884.1 hypothetical protein [Rhizobium lentis]MBB5566233.1 hypothetical protein [Rhizobium lentis]